MFYDDIFLDVLLKRLDGDRRLSRCLPNTSTFVPNDRSQCLYCVLPIMWCACGAHLLYLQAARHARIRLHSHSDGISTLTPIWKFRCAKCRMGGRDVWNTHASLSLSLSRVVWKERYVAKGMGMSREVCRERHVARGMSREVCRERHVARGMSREVCRERYVAQAAEEAAAQLVHVD